jgi:uncharacterized protein YacL
MRGEPSHTARNVLTFVGLILGLLVGAYLIEWGHLGPSLGAVRVVGVLLICGAVGGIALYLLARPLYRSVQRLTAYIESRAQRLTLAEMVSGALGLLIGLGVSYLLAPAFSAIPFLGRFLPILVSLFLGYVGLTIGLKKKEEIGTWSGVRQLALPARAGRGGHGVPKVLDTSVIIDGRIADILETQFLEGPILVPAFVLEELRHIADSADVLKRNRGRRGLDVLNRIQKDLGVTVQIVEKDFGGLEVDSKLLRLAKAVEGKVVTNDYNLNKVAALQGVPVLNINELANAVKPVVLPGEEMSVTLIKDGKEQGQGVGYLDDGTMIVVDGGKRFVGETVPVLVTSVLQTAAGRMIFAKPKLQDGGKAAGHV